MQLQEGEREIIVKGVNEILENYGHRPEKLIPMLQDVQGKLGYLPALAMEKIADALDIPSVDVFGVATFYNQFRMNPPGKYQIKVCMGTACYMVGGRIAMESFERRLDIKEGETTADRNFSLERVACVGCCSLAPVVVINEDVEGKVTPTRVDGLMLAFAAEEQKQKKAQQQEEPEEKEKEEKQQEQEQEEQQQEQKRGGEQKQEQGEQAEQEQEEQEAEQNQDAERVECEVRGE